MGGCADREDKFGKKRKFSDLKSLQEFQKEELEKSANEVRPNSFFSHKPSSQFASNISKTQGNESDDDEENEDLGYPVFTAPDSPSDMIRKVSLRFSIDRQVDTDTSILSPLFKKSTNSIDSCQSFSIIDNKRSKPVFLDFQTSINIAGDPESCIHKKKTRNSLDHCSQLTVKSFKAKKRLKIVSISSQFCHTTKPASPIQLIIDSNSRPSSPGLEHGQIFLSSLTIPSLRLKPLNKVSEVPDVGQFLRQKVSDSLSFQTENLSISISSPKRLKLANKEISIDLTSLEIGYNNSSDSSERCVEKRFSDLQIPTSPLSPFDLESFPQEPFSADINLRLSSLDLIPEIQRSSYRRATEGKQFIPRERVQMTEIPEEISDRPSLGRLSTKISELGLREAKNQALANKTRFFRRGQTLNNF